MTEVILDGAHTGVLLQRGPGPLPLGGDIAGFEQAWGHALPPDYRYFLMHYNGGCGDCRNVVTALDAALAEFFCLSAGNAGTCAPLRLPEGWREEWAGLPGHMLPIGEMDSGDLIVLVYIGGFCEVAVINHEGDSIRMEVTAPSFTDFLRGTVREEG